MNIDFWPKNPKANFKNPQMNIKSAQITSYQLPVTNYQYAKQTQFKPNFGSLFCLAVAGTATLRLRKPQRLS